MNGGRALGWLSAPIRPPRPRVPSSILLLSSVGCMMEVDVGSNQLPAPPPTNQEPVDADEDGFTSEDGDCDDDDPNLAPDLLEECDGLDNDCSGAIDVDRDDTFVCARREVFVQVISLDLLVVADRSPTAAQVLAQTAEAALELVQPLVGGAAYETHLGVITMDMASSNQQGRLVDVGRQRFVSGSSMDAAAAATFVFRALTESGTQTYGPEGGRAALDAALYDHTDGWNAGFARNGVPLVVLFLSDDEDRSEAPTPGELVEELDHSRGIANVTTHVVVQNTTRDCDGELSPETKGQTYLDLVLETDGHDLSVCEKDYAPFISEIAQSAAREGLRTRFPLHAVAAGDSLRVTLHLPGAGSIRQLTPAEYGLTDGGRTLVLLMDPPPPVRTEIEVEYHEDPR